MAWGLTTQRGCVRSTTLEKTGLAWLSEEWLILAEGNVRQQDCEIYFAGGAFRRGRGGFSRCARGFFDFRPKKRDDFLMDF